MDSKKGRGEQKEEGMIDNRYASCPRQLGGKASGALIVNDGNSKGRDFPAFFRVQICVGL